MKTRTPRGIGGTTGTLAYNIGLRIPKETKLAVERMSKLLERSENSIIIEAIMAIDEMSRAFSDKEASRMPKLVFMLRQAADFMSKKVNG